MPERCCDMHGEWCPDDALIFGACCGGCPDNPRDDEEPNPAQEGTDGR